MSERQGSVWTADKFVSSEEQEDAGGVTLNDFANALQCWALMQEREVAVAEAAAAFNTTLLVVVAGVQEHPWMALGHPSGELVDRPFQDNETCARALILHEGM